MNMTSDATKTVARFEPWLRYSKRMWVSRSDQIRWRSNIQFSDRAASTQSLDHEGQWLRKNLRVIALAEVRAHGVRQLLAGEIEIGLDARLVSASIDPVPTSAQPNRVEAVKTHSSRIGIIEEQSLVTETRWDAAGPQDRCQKVRFGETNPLAMPNYVGGRNNHFRCGDVV